MKSQSSSSSSSQVDLEPLSAQHTQRGRKLAPERPANLLRLILVRLRSAVMRRPWLAQKLKRLLLDQKPKWFLKLNELSANYTPLAVDNGNRVSDYSQLKSVRLIMYINSLPRRAEESSVHYIDLSEK